VENAVKIARSATGRPAVIAFSGGFHGRTMMGMALTGKVAPYKLSFGPFPADIFHAPFPIDYHGLSVDDALAGLDRLLHSDVDPQRVAALIIEPVLGEGGFYPAPPEFLQALRRVCDEHGIVMILDEIQTGFARTGRMFATEYAGIEPDMITTAKSLAGGFPLSAVTGKAAIMDKPHPGGLGGTYAGSPLACAAALAVMQVIEEEKLADRALKLGDFMAKRMQALADEKAGACIGNIRNLGAMAAMELVTDRNTREPDAALTKAVVQKALEKGLILLSCGVRGNVVRFLPPLTTSDELMAEGFDILRETLTELKG
jgi:4-aminobutyrate aminotransferase/(S)-3-amino-2-methylpropionate transaminase